MGLLRDAIVSYNALSKHLQKSNDISSILRELIQSFVLTN